MKIKIDSYRRIPAGTEFFSISLQDMVSMKKDLIVQIKHTCFGSDFVFAKPIWTPVDMPGIFPTVIGKGSDEISISFSNTKPYKIPKPIFLDFSYSKK